jgi:hypothetical protein
MVPVYALMCVISVFLLRNGCVSRTDNQPPYQPLGIARRDTQVVGLGVVLTLHR